MKTKEELNALKEEVTNLNEKLSVLTEEELEQVTGGLVPDIGNMTDTEPTIRKPSVIEPPVLDMIEQLFRE